MSVNLVFVPLLKCQEVAGVLQPTDEFARLAIDDFENAAFVRREDPLILGDGNGTTHRFDDRFDGRDRGN